MEARALAGDDRACRGRVRVRVRVRVKFRVRVRVSATIVPVGASSLLRPPHATQGSTAKGVGQFERASPG